MEFLKLGINLFIRDFAELTAIECSAWDKSLDGDADLNRAFLSRTYTNAVVQAGCNVLIVVIYRANQPVFFLPIQRLPGLQGVLGIFEPVGGSMTDYFGAIASDGFKITPEDILNASGGRINVIVFTHLDQTQGKFGLKGGDPRVGLRTFLGEEPSTYWVELRKTDKKLVSDTERRQKKLANECGELTFEWASATSEADLCWLIESKRSQYTRTGKELAPLFIEGNVKLLKNLLTTTDEACSGVLSVLRCGDKVVAAHFGLRCRNVLHVWFPVYDQSYSQYSPGRILFKHLFEAGAIQGVTLFDRGEGDTQAKRDFSNDEHVFSRGVWQASGLRGLMARVALSISWRIQR